MRFFGKGRLYLKSVYFYFLRGGFRNFLTLLKEMIFFVFSFRRVSTFFGMFFGEEDLYRIIIFYNEFYREGVLFCINFSGGSAFRGWHVSEGKICVEFFRLFSLQGGFPDFFLSGRKIFWRYLLTWGLEERGIFTRFSPNFCFSVEGRFCICLLHFL